MENYNNDIFNFESESNELQNDSKNFDYNTISGLGQSDYDNEDIFENSVKNVQNNNVSYDGTITFDDTDDDNDDDGGRVFDDFSSVTLDDEEQPTIEESNNYGLDYETINNQPIVEESNNDNLAFETTENQPIIEESNNDNLAFETTDNQSTIQELNDEKLDGPNEDESQDNDGEDSNIKISETPIDELNDLTINKPEKLEITNITELFDKVSVNVKDASDIFKRNSEMKQKIDTRFEELRKLQSELDSSKQSQIEEINKYKKEVFNKLNAKKIEIEKRLNTLKDLQATLERDKDNFEQYKKTEQDKIVSVQKDVQKAYDDRREELNKIEEELRRQKDLLDEEKNQLSLDRIQYEADKNDLANNILKFNELVDSFNQSVNGVRE